MCELYSFFLVRIALRSMYFTYSTLAAIHKSTVFLSSWSLRECFCESGARSEHANRRRVIAMSGVLRFLLADNGNNVTGERTPGTLRTRQMMSCWTRIRARSSVRPRPSALQWSISMWGSIHVGSGLLIPVVLRSDARQRFGVHLHARWFHLAPRSRGASVEQDRRDAVGWTPFPGRPGRR